MAYFLNSSDVNQTFIIEPLVIDDITVTAATYNQNSGVMTFFNSTGGTFTVNGLYTSSNAGVVTGAANWHSTGTGAIELPNITVALFDNPNNIGTANIYSVLSGTTGLGGIPSLVDNDTNYIVIDYNGGSPKYDVLNNDTAIDDSSIVLYLIVYRAGIHIHVLDFGNQGAGLPNKLNDRVIMTQRFARESGFMIDLSGNTGIVTVSSGVSWNGTNRQELAAINSYNDIFFKNYHVNGAWVYDTTGDTINNTYYDNGTDLVVADAGKYLVNWYFRGQEVNDHIYEVFGRGQYDTLLDAEGSTEPPLPELITSHAFLVGRIVVQQGQFSGVPQTAFGTVFQSYGAVSVHNDLVDIQGGANNQYYHLSLDQYNHVPYTNQDNTFVGNLEIQGGITGNSLSATSIEVVTGVVESLNGNALTYNTISGSSLSSDSLNVNNGFIDNVSGNTGLFNNVEVGNISATTINGDSVTANQISGASINANTINSSLITSSLFSGDSAVLNVFTANTISATTIFSPTIDNLFHDELMVNQLCYFLPSDGGTLYDTLRANGTLLSVGTASSLSENPMGILYTTALATSSVTAVYGNCFGGNILGVNFQFEMIRRFRINTTNSAQRFFAGLSAAYGVSAPTNIEPTNQISCIGVAKLQGSNNFFFVWNDATGIASSLDLGANFPANNNSYTYKLRIWKTFGVAAINLELTRITNSTGAVLVATTTITSDYNTGSPTYPVAWMGNNTAASGSVSFKDYGCILTKRNAINT